MKRKVLDIWAIETDPNELYTALAQLKTDVTIFENVICEFKIGAHVLQNRQFGTVIYSEESDTIILLTRGGKATVAQAEKYLEEHKIDYNKIVFIKDTTPYKDAECKDYWFARDKYVLDDALDNSLNNGVKDCEYDATIKASITFRYLGKNERKYQLLKIPFKGMLELDDKFILITNSKYNKNITPDVVIDTLNKKGFETGIIGLREYI